MMMTIYQKNTKQPYKMYSKCKLKATMCLSECKMQVVVWHQRIFEHALPNASDDTFYYYIYEAISIQMTLIQLIKYAKPHNYKTV